MSWETGKQRKQRVNKVNEKLSKIEGYLEEKDAKLLLYEFMRENISFSTRLLMGVDLFPFQHMMIKAMFEADYFMGILSRGGSKTYSTSIFLALYAIMNQGIHIGVVSASFRQSKAIARKLIDISKKPEGKFLAQCMHVSMAPDEWNIEIGQSKVTILPLGSGEKLRGFRFQVMVIDELLLMPQKVLSEVILPFLAVVTNPTEREKVKKAEDKLIAAGKMKEEDRKVWPNNKIIGLSSASYSFEYLFTLYKQYEEAILSGKDQNGKYSIFHIAYSALPPALYDAALIAKSRAEMSQSQFDREYEAKFVSDSSGFFKVSKMQELTFPDGEGQMVEVIGEQGAEYIVSIDPSWSESESSDDFSIQLLKLNKVKREGVLVHTYAISGANLKNHIHYFYYILTHFNVVFIAGDYNGAVQFITSCNESELFKKNKMEIKTIDANFDDQTIYDQSIGELRQQYNLTDRKICLLKSPSSEWIRIANESLQSSIDNKKIWFASKSMDEDFELKSKTKIPISTFNFIRGKAEDDGFKGQKLDEARMVDFIENLKANIEMTKVQCALIEPKASSQGTMSFDLPDNLKRQRGANKARKDCYSALLLANWGARVYFDMMTKPVENIQSTFTPFFC